MLFELLVRFIVITFDRGFFNSSIHSLNLTVRPRVIDFCQTMFNSVLSADAVK